MHRSSLYSSSEWFRAAVLFFSFHKENQHINLSSLKYLQTKLPVVEFPETMDLGDIYQAKEETYDEQNHILEFTQYKNFIEQLRVLQILLPHIPKESTVPPEFVNSDVTTLFGSDISKWEENIKAYLAVADCFHISEQNVFVCVKDSSTLQKLEYHPCGELVKQHVTLLTILSDPDKKDMVNVERLSMVAIPLLALMGIYSVVAALIAWLFKRLQNKNNIEKHIKRLLVDRREITQDKLDMVISKNLHDFKTFTVMFISIDILLNDMFDIMRNLEKRYEPEDVIKSIKKCPFLSVTPLDKDGIMTITYVGMPIQDGELPLGERDWTVRGVEQAISYIQKYWNLLGEISDYFNTRVKDSTKENTEENQAHYGFFAGFGVLLRLTYWGVVEQSGHLVKLVERLIKMKTKTKDVSTESLTATDQEGLWFSISIDKKNSHLPYDNPLAQEIKQQISQTHGKYREVLNIKSLKVRSPFNMGYYMFKTNVDTHSCFGILTDFASTLTAYTDRVRICVKQCSKLKESFEPFCRDTAIEIQ